MNNDSGKAFAFGPFPLDPVEHYLLRDGKAVCLAPKAFKTLVVLVTSSGRLVEKDELPREVWPDTCRRGDTRPDHLQAQKGIVRLTAEDVHRLFMRHTSPMRTSVSLYHRHRFPAEIISHCVWLYFRFALSFRDVEEMLAMRGVSLSYETVREWCLKFGRAYANGLRRRSSRPGDRWHLDEVFLKINGRLHYLWRAVDQDGDVLDILVQSRRDKRTAKKFFRKLLKGLRYVPRVIITDKLRSYSAAKAEVCPVSSTARTRDRTTGPKIRISQRGCGSV